MVEHRDVLDDGLGSQLSPPGAPPRRPAPRARPGRREPVSAWPYSEARRGSREGASGRPGGPARAAPRLPPLLRSAVSSPSDRARDADAAALAGPRVGAASPWRTAAVVGAGVLVQAALLAESLADPRPLLGDELHYWSVGLAIAGGSPPPPDFVWPPLYSWLLSLSARVFGPALLPVQLLQSALFVAAALLLRSLLLRAPLPARAADAGMLLLLVDLEAAAFCQYFWPEVVFLFLVLAGAWGLLAPQRPGRGVLFLSGAAFGAALLTKALLSVFVPLLVVAAALRCRDDPAGRRLVRAAAFAAGLALLPLPVACWNGLRHGSFTVSSSGLFNLWVGLNDPPSTRDYNSVPSAEMSDYLASGTRPAERNAALLPRIRALVASRGLLPTLAAQLEKQYFRLFNRSSYFTDRLPGGTLAPPGARASRRTGLLRTAAHGTYAVVLSLGAAGLALGLRRELLRAWALPYLWVALQLGLFLFLHVKTRYRIGLLPALVAFAALAVTRIPKELAGGRPGGRLVAGLALAAGALFLAFHDLDP